MAYMKHRETNMANWVGCRPAHNGEQIVLSDGASNEIRETYTVDDGKVLFITHFNMSSSASVAVASASLFIDTAVPALWMRLCHHYYQQVGNHDSVADLRYPLEVPAGYIIKLQASNATTRAYSTLIGWLEDA